MGTCRTVQPDVAHVESTLRIPANDPWTQLPSERGWLVGCHVPLEQFLTACGAGMEPRSDAHPGCANLQPTSVQLECLALKTSLAVLCVLHPAVNLASGAPAAARVIAVQSGADFVEAYNKYLDGDRGEEVWQLTPPLVSMESLENATWEVTSSPPPELQLGGPLTIRGGSSTGMTVLDTAMRSGLSSGLPLGTQVTFQDLVLINSCSKLVQWNPEAHLSGLDSHSLWFFPRSRIMQTITRKNVQVYVTPQEHLVILTWLSLSMTPFQEIRDGWAAVALKLFADTHAVVSHMDEFSLTFDFVSLAGGLDFNVTVRTTNNPEDPLGFSLPELGGSLMPHRLCAPDGDATGPLLSNEEVFEANMTAFPTYVGSNSLQLSNALVAISRSGLNGVTVGGQVPVPIIVIIRDVSVIQSGRVIPAATLRSDTLLQGPFTPDRPVLNFSFQADMLRAPRANVFFTNLVLAGLVSKRVSGGGGREAKSTALPFYAIDRPASQKVRVSNVTVHLPVSDFLVLISAANRGPKWKHDTTGTAGFIMEHIDAFQPKLFNRSVLLLSEYSGFGVEGGDVQFVPVSPLSDLEELLDQLDTEKEEGSDPVALGVGIGVGVGVGLLLLLLIATALAILLRWRAGQEERATTEPVAIESVKLIIPPDNPQDPKHSGEDILERQQIDYSVQVPAGNSADSQGEQGSKIFRVIADNMPLSRIACEQPSRPSTPKRASDVHTILQERINKLVREGRGDILKLESMIGKGAWGAVYKGTWKGLTVAVKTILFTDHSAGPSQTASEYAHALAEAAVALSLSHPNLVSTYYYDLKPVSHDESPGVGLQVGHLPHGHQDWKLFLVQEYCQCTIAQAMHSNALHRGNVPRVERILKLMLDVAKGTLNLHLNNIIHGDLKPDNILLKVDNKCAAGLIAKITDFGLATSLGPTATHASNFRSGTPFYCAPEVAVTGRTGKTTDSYSFGVVLSECASKVSPWMLVDGAYIANPHFPCHSPGMPAAYARLAMRCLDLDKDKRPMFAEIVTSLEGMLDALDDSFD